MTGRRATFGEAAHATFPMSHPALSATDDWFAGALAESARGPARDAVFGLWLVARAALGAVPLHIAPVSPSSPAAAARHAERLKAVAARLRSLNPPAPLKRALAAAVVDLGPLRRLAPTVVLTQLEGPAGECLGRRAADALHQAARAARGAA